MAESQEYHKGPKNIKAYIKLLCKEAVICDKMKVNSGKMDRKR